MLFVLGKVHKNILRIAIKMKVNLLNPIFFIVFISFLFQLYKLIIIILKIIYTPDRVERLNPF